MVVSIFIIYIFCICAFIYSEKLMCSSKISISKQFPGSLINMGMYAHSRKLESPGVHLFNWGWRRHNLASCCSFYTVNKCLLYCPISNMFLTFVFISLVIFLLKLLLLFSYQDISDFLRPHELQHARLPCPTPSSRVCPNSCPLNMWCHTTISSSVILFSLSLRSPSMRWFSNKSAVLIRYPKYWSFSFSFIISTSKEYSGLISLKIVQFDDRKRSTSRLYIVTLVI